MRITLNDRICQFSSYKSRPKVRRQNLTWQSCFPWKCTNLFCWHAFSLLTLLHSERPKLYAVLVFLSAIGLKWRVKIQITVSKSWSVIAVSREIIQENGENFVLQNEWINYSPSRSYVARTNDTFYHTTLTLLSTSDTGSILFFRMSGLIIAHLEVKWQGQMIHSTIPH